MALSSSQLHKRELQEKTCPMDTLNCKPCPWFVMLVDEPDMVPFIFFHGKKFSVLQQSGHRYTKEDIRIPNAQPGYNNSKTQISYSVSPDNTMMIITTGYASAHRIRYDSEVSLNLFVMTSLSVLAIGTLTQWI